MMKNQSYPTVEQSLTSLRNHVKIFDSEEVTTDKHGLWSIKKLIVLRYYIYPFLQILRANKYEKIHYVDLFAGSGLLRIEDKIMPGTPLVPLLTSKDLITIGKNYYFDEYHLSDSNQKYIDVLKKRIKKVSDGLPTKIQIEKLRFADAVDKIFPGKPPAPDARKKNAYLTVLDPYGFDIDWNHLMKIFQSGSVDVVTFPTRNVSWNQNKEQSEQKLTDMFGGKEWLSCTNEDEFLHLYCEKIEKIPVEWKQFKTKSLTVDAGSTKYHLICASRAPSAENIFSDMQKKFDEVNLDMLSRAFSIAAKGQQKLDQSFK